MEITIERVGEGVLVTIDRALLLFDTTTDAMNFASVIMRVCTFGADALADPAARLGL